MGNKEKEKKEKKQKKAEEIQPQFAANTDRTKFNSFGKINKKFYEDEIANLQSELVKLEYFVKEKGLKIVIIFEGRDAAGKGGVIKRITEPMNPRGCRVVALDKPSDKEKTQWYFQRYVAHLPSAGEIVIFDRSWYNRAVVEKVMGFCTDDEYNEFMRSCPDFERMLQRSGIILLKYWFSVSDEEQEKRFRERAMNPDKRWKLSPMDIASYDKYIEFSKAKDEMFKFTDTKQSPWFNVEADDKKKARLNCIAHILRKIPFEDVTPPPMELPARQVNSNYVRPPREEMNQVPQVY